MMRIKNGGIECGLLEAVAQNGGLTEREAARLKQLQALPVDEWVYLDKNGEPMSGSAVDEYIETERKRFHLEKSDFILEREALA